MDIVIISSVSILILVTLAVIILPITSGDTELRGLRITIAEAINLEQRTIINRLFIVIPLLLCVLGILTWA